MTIVVLPFFLKFPSLHLLSDMLVGKHYVEVLQREMHSENRAQKKERKSSRKNEVVKKENEKKEKTRWSFAT
jgi:hypothetical protein